MINDIDIDYEEVLLHHLNIINSYGFDTELDQIYFKGFWSQGDGASFDFNNVDIEIFLQKLKLKSEYKKLRSKINDIDLKYYSYKNSFSTHYCHEKTRVTVYDYNSYNVSSNLVNLIEQLKTRIEEIRLELCYSLYNDLEEHYDESYKLYEEYEEYEESKEEMEN